MVLLTEHGVLHGVQIRMFRESHLANSMWVFAVMDLAYTRHRWHYLKIATSAVEAFIGHKHDFSNIN